MRNEDFMKKMLLFINKLANPMKPLKYGKCKYAFLHHRLL
jgi:hypothetical protein